MTDRPLRWLKRLALALIVICGPASLAQTPSSSQLETFRRLPAGQQRELLESMGDTDNTSRSVDEQSRTDTSQLPSQSDGQSIRSNNNSRLWNGSLPNEELPRIEARGTVLLDVTIREEFEKQAVAVDQNQQTQTPPPTTVPVQPSGDEKKLTEEDKKRIRDRWERIRAANPYKLDDEARLLLPFLPPIALGGLTSKEAAQRLNADPRLEGLRFAVVLLPVAAVGAEALKPFGYELFKESRERFLPGRDLPVPRDYIVGPGDNITIELFGGKVARYRLVVNRDGALNIPDFGPIQVSGSSFDQVRAEIEKRVTSQMIGVRPSVTMGEMRALRIFVVGDVVDPGSHAISSSSTITTALFASGGVSEAGSLRNIEVKRRGASITKFDLYDLLLEGDTSRDIQLQQGDAILVPPVGLTAGVAGLVRRPAIYEFRAGATVKDLIQLSGGLKPEAAQTAAKLQRVDPSGERTVLNLNLGSGADLGRTLHAGDVLIVPKILEEYAGGVTLEGHVLRPGPYGWQQGMRLTDLLGSLQTFQVNADQRYVLIRREHMPDRRIDFISADAVAAFAAKGSQADPQLSSRDRIIVFSRQADRGTTLASLLEEARLQTRDNQPIPLVSISGRVRAPGDYPYEPNMTVSDLVRAGGGMDDSAYAQTAELTRYEVINGDNRKTEVVDLDLRGLTAGNTGADLPIRPYDFLVIKEVPEWREMESVLLEGEVKFPGKYPIRRGETMSSLIARAGGLTQAAFPAGSVFTREELKKQEREQVEVLTNRLQSDLGLLALQNAQTNDQKSGETLTAGQSLLQQLRNAEPKGRLVVDVQRALALKNSEDDIQLRDGDTLHIPRLRQYVTVIGEVQNATSHVWRSGLGKDDYLGLSGGTTPRADSKRIYVVRANGSVVANKSDNRWFTGGAALQPGDTIVVPIDAERMRALPLWTAVSSVVSNLAITAAALTTL